MVSQLTLDLYVDDTGSRYPDYAAAEHRRDGMDAFALGGILVDSERAPEIFDLHRQLVERLGLSYPLHSHSIRTRTEDFEWITKDPKRADLLYAGIRDLIERMAAVVHACVVSRPGYNARYKAVYGPERWRLCRSAYAILVERAAKWAEASGRWLKVYVEQTGKKEDRAIRAYHRELCESGMYFDAIKSAGYSPLAPDRLREILFKSVQFVTKENPWTQVADLVLYLVVKGKYVPTYPPYRHLVEAGKLIDTHVGGDPARGIKYYCFDQA